MLPYTALCHTFNLYTAAKIGVFKFQVLSPQNVGGLRVKVLRGVPAPDVGVFSGDNYLEIERDDNQQQSIDRVISYKALKGVPAPDAGVFFRGELLGTTMYQVYT